MIKPDKLNLKQWALEDRPREKMKQKGAGALTNAELLAILIHTGNTEDSVVALTQKVMASCRNSLSELGKLSVGELCSFKGIGEAKAITILAACELGRRRKEEKPEGLNTRCGPAAMQGRTFSCQFRRIICECW